MDFLCVRVILTPVQSLIHLSRLASLVPPTSLLLLLLLLLLLHLDAAKPDADLVKRLAVGVNVCRCQNLLQGTVVHAQVG